MTGVQPQQSVTGQNAGYYQFNCISGLIWNDANNDGIYSSTSEFLFDLSNVTINLINVDTNQTVASVTTAKGTYQFCSLNPAHYVVQYVVDPTNFYFTVCNATFGQFPSLQSSVCSGDISNVVDLTGMTGMMINGVNAGLVSYSSIGGYVWNDQIPNGLQNIGEERVPGIQIDLISVANGSVVASTLSDGNGSYLFSMLKLGAYVIRSTVNASIWTYTVPDRDPQHQIDSHIDNFNRSTGVGTTSIISLPSGINMDNIDIGIFYWSSIGNLVWYDTLIQDGVHQGGEPGAANVTVLLLNGTNFQVIESTTTDANGNYLFDKLLPGVYLVEVQFDNSSVVCPQTTSSQNTVYSPTAKKHQQQQQHAATSSQKPSLMKPKILVTATPKQPTSSSTTPTTSSTNQTVSSLVDY